MARKMQRKKLRNTRRGELLFYCSIVALPIVNYLVFTFFSGYIYIFIFSVQAYDDIAQRYVFTSDIWVNFRAFFDEFVNTPGFMPALLNSVIIYVVGWVTMPVSLFVSYYIAKKMPGSNVFKFILMMPSMISGMVWVLVFKFFVDRSLPLLFGWEMGPLSNIETQFITLVIYSVWIGLAGNMLLYTGVLSGVSDSVIDAGRIDGLGMLGEFWYISMPTLYPVWTVGVITGIAGFFGASPGIVEFMGYDADPAVHTIGYVMFSRVMKRSDIAMYGFNAAGTLCFSLVAMPITLIVRWVLERYGPSEDTRKPIHWFWQRRDRE